MTYRTARRARWDACPIEVQTTGVSITKNTGSFVVAYGFYADNKEYDNLFISNYLDLYVRDAIKRVKGVGNVIIFGERKYSMRLWLDPVRLAARGLTAADVTAALARAERPGSGGTSGTAARAVEPVLPDQRARRGSVERS